MSDHNINDVKRFWIERIWRNKMAKQDAQPDGMSTPLGGGGGVAGIGSNTAPHLAYHDLRKWLEEAQKLGEVKTVKGLSWQRDIGMVSELAAHTDNAPCFVFEDVPGTLPGSRLLINFFDGKRKNMTLGFPTDLNKVELSEGFRAHYAADMKRIPPRFVETGPVMQNVMTGDKIDVTRFPAPQWHGKDGGRYIGTGCYTIIRDPDEGWINCGTYRVMIHDATSCGLYISPGKQGRQMRDKYKARGEPMPIAVVLGGDPMSFLMGCSEVPYGVSELEVIGGMRGSAVEVIKGPVTGLPLPANAEIVIEGFVEPDKMRTEGPFGEWTGYYATGAAQEPVLDIKAIYYRNEPILLGVVPERPPDEICRYRAIVRSALLRDNIQKAGVPAVTAAWAHEVGNARLLLVVAINQRYPGHAKQAGHIASMCHVGAYFGRYTIVVDDDINVSDINEVLWALLTRSDPATSIDIIRNAWSTPLDPRIEPERRAVGDYTNSRAVIDACRPFHWRDKFPEVNMPTPEDKALALRKFGHLFTN
jgi:4-hydroxy-3-polyprenylbenzoate decarboxylase